MLMTRRVRPRTHGRLNLYVKDDRCEICKGKCYILDVELGSERGGGEIVAAGTQETVAKIRARRLAASSSHCSSARKPDLECRHPDLRLHRHPDPQPHRHPGAG